MKNQVKVLRGKYCVLIFSVLIAIPLIFLLCACSSSSKGTPDAASELTQSLEFNGVRIGYPSDWKTPSYSSNVFQIIDLPSTDTVQSYSALKISTYLNRKSNDIQSYSPSSSSNNGNNNIRSGVSYSKVDSWKDGSVDFAEYAGSYALDERTYEQKVLIAFDTNTKKAILVEVHLQPEMQTKENEDLINAIFKTIEVDFSELRTDSGEEFQKNINSNSSSSSSQSNTVAAFDPKKTYKQGDIVKFDGYSLGGEQTQDGDTGKKGAVIFFSTNKSSSTENAQAIILLDTVRATTAGTPVVCTAVCAVIGEDGVPIFTEM